MSLFKDTDATTTTNKPTIVIFKATQYEDAQVATLQLQSGKAVLIDLTALKDVELIKGYTSLEEACNLLNCQLREVSASVYLLTPTNFEVVVEPHTAQDASLDSSVKNLKENNDQLLLRAVLRAIILFVANKAE